MNLSLRGASRCGVVCSAGFSLLETMAVLVIIGILTVVALPSYSSAICKVRRAEGRAALLQLMHQQEQVYTQRLRYVAFSAAATDDAAAQFKWYSGTTARSSAYEIEAEPCPGSAISECILLSARPGTARVSGAHSDAQCGVLRLDSFGRRSADAAGCW